MTLGRRGCESVKDSGGTGPDHYGAKKTGLASRQCCHSSIWDSSCCPMRHGEALAPRGPPRESQRHFRGSSALTKKRADAAAASQMRHLATTDRQRLCSGAARR
jgi:hypothetical protein